MTISISVADYGAFMQIQAVTSLISYFCLLGFDGGIVKYLENADAPQRLFSSLLLVTSALGALAALIVAMTADLWATLTLSSDSFSTLFAVGALYIPASVLFQLGRAHYRARRRVKRYSLFEGVDVYLTVGGIAIAVLLFDIGIVGAAVIMIGARLLATLLAYGGIARADGLGWPTLTGFRECLKFSLETMVHRISQSLLDRADRILLGTFIGAGAVGIYSAAYSVSYVMLLYFRPLSISFFPEFSRLWERDETETINRYTRLGIRYLVGLGLPSIAGFMLIGRVVLNLLSTDDLAAAALIPLIILATAMLFKGLQEIYTQLFYATGTSRIPAIIQGGAALLNVALNIALIPSFGVAGAAATSALSFGLAMVASVALFQRELRTDIPWVHIGQTVIATSIMVMIFSVVSISWWATLGIAPIVYAVALVALGGVERTELRQVIQILR